MALIELSPERREKEDLWETQMPSGSFEILDSRNNKKKCISFIIWLTALAYNEMLINWPLFISLVICKFTLIILLFHLELTHGHIADSLSLFISLYFWFTMFCKSFRGKCKQWLQHSLRWITFGAKMQIYVSLRRRVYRLSSSRISIS